MRRDNTAKWANEPASDDEVPDEIAFADAEAIGLSPEEFATDPDFARSYRNYLRTLATSGQ
jgi:hypothetical protein